MLDVITSQGLATLPLPATGMGDNTIDLTIIVIYLLGILGVGIFAARHLGRTSTDYFLAGRSLRWPVIGLALFATNISTVHLVGLAADGYRLGLVIGNFEWMAAFCLVLLGMVFAPFYFKSKVATLPDYLEKRFSGGSRTMLAFMAVVGALFIHIGMSLYAGSAILESFFGINVVTSIMIISLVTVIYTVVGGLKAVVVTESIQTVLLLVGAVAVTVFAMIALSDKGIHSYADLKDAIDRQESADRTAMVAAVQQTQDLLVAAADHHDADEWATQLHEAAAQLQATGALPGAVAAMTDGGFEREANMLSAAVGSPAIRGTDFAGGNLADLSFDQAAQTLTPVMDAWQKQADEYAVSAQTGEHQSLRTSMVHTSGGLSWYAVLLGYPILGIWYWCADQTIVQRVLGARSKADAQIGPIFAGFIKILPVFIMVWPGIFAYVLFSDQIGNNYNATLPVLIEQLIPIGLKGLIAAGLLAALMSTIAGALNSTATLVSLDIVKRLRPRTSEATLVRCGRITACVVMVLAMLWSTQGGRFESIFTGLNAMIACLAPPITAVFLFGVFWPRGTQQASLATLLLGFMLGAITFTFDFPLIGDTRVVTEVLGIPFMLQAWWLFVICSGIFITVSLATPTPAPEKVRDLCWTNPLAALQSEGMRRLSDPRLLSACLIVVMVILYWTFA